MRPFLDVLLIVLDLYWYVMLASVIISWLVSFNIINTQNSIVSQIVELIYRLTKPVLAPIRKVLPNMGGLDLSPIIVFLGITFLRSAIINYLY